MNAQTEARPSVPALMVGGSVTAVIPQSIEEIWRVSKMVLMGGLAPKALVGKKNGDEAISAVAIAIMAGAELGLPPMVALRSFTVISGKPALYGDGLINVVRRSRKAASITTGYDAERGVGWCEAKRADTGEEKREEFSIEDAKRAGLWDERKTASKWDYDSKSYKDAPNEAPWHRYPHRMLTWRATGYCLRELFADVLGGVTDEYEAREIAGEMREVNPEERPTPPKPPVPPKPPAPTIEHGEPQETIDAETGEILPPTPPKPPAPPAAGKADPFAALLIEVDAKMAKAKDEGDWSTVRTEYAHLQEQLSDQEWEDLDAVMHQHYERIRDADERAEMMRQPYAVG